MKYGQYKFHCFWNDEAYLPPFQGSMLRGALGSALKETICIVRDRCCETCLLKGQCVYAKTFEYQSANPELANKMGVNSLPHPYMIIWEPEQSGSYKKRQNFSFSLALFGEFTQYLPYFIIAVQKMGEKGLGRKNGQGKYPKFSLHSIEWDGTIVYSASDQVLQSGDLFIDLSVEFAVPTSISNLALNFVTPLRVKTGNQFARKIDLELVIKAAMRRIRSLWEAYSEKTPDFNYREMISLAKKIDIIEHKFFWKEQKRYSSRQKTEMQFGGLVGTLECRGDFSQLISCLQLGERLHIGKATSFGLGRYQTILGS